MVQFADNNSSSAPLIALVHSSHTDRCLTADIRTPEALLSSVAGQTTKRVIVDQGCVRCFLASSLSLGNQTIALWQSLIAAALFLASDDSSYVTGIDLLVDGGLVLG